MKKIKLTKNQYALVDDEDYERLTQRKWSFQNYAVRGVYSHMVKGKSQYKAIYMHKEVLGTELQVDHINGNKLDNRKSNLRLATVTQNSHNRSKRSNTKSVYKGVHPYLGKSWRAIITVDKKPVLIGHFPNERWAAMAYDLNAQLAFGEFAKTNFNKWLN